LGFAGLFRSDHFTNAEPPDIDSLELWVSLTWLASHTKRIEFGPIVSPVSFRNPVFTARMGKDVDDLSGGRLVLGVGAGWQVREHRNFGFDLLEVGPRLDRFEEGLEVISRLLRRDEPVTYAGTYYHVQDAIWLPRPQRPGGPRLLIGGNGPQRTLPLAARFAEEWNGVFIPAARYAELNQRLSGLLEVEGRDPKSVRRSIMTNVLFGRDDAEVIRKVGDHDPSALQARGILMGTRSALQDQLAALEEAGAQRALLQWLNLDDLDGLEALAKAIL
jgi:alkanesulfonate monooxygenase SsuD/methylene tetrahydromethanopterin reductase-like flavin-dependent oxidoreductase (luciferase family)